MRDLKLFTDSGTVNVTMRTDIINSETRNFTVFQIKGLEDTANLNFRELAILEKFKILPYNLDQVIQFAEVYGLNLVSYNADGTDPVVLVGDSNSDSFS